MGFWKANRELRWSKDGKAIVEADDPQAGTHYASPGTEVPEEMLKRFKVPKAPPAKARDGEDKSRTGRDK